MALLVGCAASAPPANPLSDLATPKSVAGPGPYSFDCDAEAGHFREMNIAAPGGRLRITGRVVFLAVRSTDDWAASATVSVAGRNKMPKVGLQAIVYADAPEEVQFAIRGMGDAQERTPFLTAFGSEGPTPFIVTLDRSGRLAVTVSGVAAEMHVAALDQTRVNLFCSTAHVRFSDVIVATD